MTVEAATSESGPTSAAGSVATRTSWYAYVPLNRLSPGGLNTSLASDKRYGLEELLTRHWEPKRNKYTTCSEWYELFDFAMTCTDHLAITAAPKCQSRTEPAT